jgi:hypothetical protein
VSRCSGVEASRGLEIKIARGEHIVVENAASGDNFMASFSYHRGYVFLLLSLLSVLLLVLLLLLVLQHWVASWSL